MVFIVISSVDRGKNVYWVPRQSISAMVCTGLEGRKGRKHHAFSESHARAHDSHDKSSDAKKQALEWVVVDSAPAIRHVQFVMSGMEISYDSISL